MHTCWEIKNADKARKLYRETTFPSPKRFIDLLDLNYFQNCPINSSDTRRYMDMCGVDMAYLKGKTTRDHPYRVAVIQNTPIPKTIWDRYLDITLCADFFYAQGIVFFHTIFRNIHFRTVGHMRSRLKATMVLGLRRIICMYESRGFRVTNIHADPEFL